MNLEVKEGELIDPARLEQIIRKSKTLKAFSVSVLLLDYLDEKERVILEVRKEGKKFSLGLSDPSAIDSVAKDIATNIEMKRRKESTAPKSVKDYLKDLPKEPLAISGKIQGSIRDALIRCGLIKHANLENDVMRFLKNYDDVILACDTNGLLDCVITSILLPEINVRINEEIKGCPNWLLFVIPRLVMSEIERKATQKFSGIPKMAGWPTYEGRMGQRALQEILTLDMSKEYRGLSLMTIGEIPQYYEDLRKSCQRMDGEIRKQVRDFLKSVDFHKGIFFLTQDRVNAMMARTEGIQSLYFQKPQYKELTREKLKTENISSVLYELAVTFGEITVEKLGKLSIFWPGKHVTHWEESRMRITEVKL